jgi:hypothetical protein
MRVSKKQEVNIMERIIRKIGFPDEAFDMCFDYGFECTRRLADGRRELCDVCYIDFLDENGKFKIGELIAKVFISISGLREITKEFPLSGDNAVESMRRAFNERVFDDYKETAKRCLAAWYKEIVPDESISVTDFYLNLLSDDAAVTAALKGKNGTGSKVCLSGTPWKEDLLGLEYRAISEDYCGFLCAYPAGEKREKVLTDNDLAVGKFIGAFNDEKYARTKMNCDDEEEERWNSDAELMTRDSKEFGNAFMHKRLYSFDCNKMFERLKYGKVVDYEGDYRFFAKQREELKIFLEELEKPVFRRDMCGGERIRLESSDIEVYIEAVEVIDGEIYVYGSYNNGFDTVIFRSPVDRSGSDFTFNIERENNVTVFEVEKNELYLLYAAGRF